MLPKKMSTLHFILELEPEIQKLVLDMHKILHVLKRRKTMMVPCFLYSI